MTSLLKDKLFVLSLIGFITLCQMEYFHLLHPLDTWVYSQAMHAAYSQSGLYFWYMLTNIGSGFFVYTMLVVFASSLLFKIRSKKIILYILLIIALFNLPLLIKLLFAVPRPVGFAAFYPELKSYAFPSGHAFNAVVLFYFTPRFLRDFVYPNTSPSTTMSLFLSVPFEVIGILLIALSRVFLGVHWFSDIVGGVLLGLVICRLLLMCKKWALAKAQSSKLHAPSRVEGKAQS